MQHTVFTLWLVKVSIWDLPTLLAFVNIVWTPSYKDKISVCGDSIYLFTYSHLVEVVVVVHSVL